MTLVNHLAPETLPGMALGEIAALPAEELARLQRDSEEHLRKARLIVSCLNGALLLKYGPQADAARASAGKTFGTVRFQDGPVTVLADLPKKVEWDQAQLAALADQIRIGGEDPAEYIDVSLKVAERKYGSWPEHLRQIFEPARTVRSGSESYTLMCVMGGAP